MTELTTMRQAAEKLADAILGEDVPAENLYGIVDLVLRRPEELDDQLGFEALCESQLELHDPEVMGESYQERIPVLREAKRLWGDTTIRALAIEIVRTRCHEALAVDAGFNSESF